MNVHVFEDKQTMGTNAARMSADKLRAAINRNGKAVLILATGASQFEMLDHLVQEDIAWPKVEVFHLDEYLGLDISHPASFRKYLQERFVDRIDGLAAFHGVQGDAGDPQAECKRLSRLISATTVDVACVGIGENGHLAFNDPPADFETTTPYIVVDLDEACRRQQLGEGWFPTLQEVPQQAISMTCREILRARTIVCTVPDQRKAAAVQRTVEGPVNPQCPASILQEHTDTHLVLDTAAASQLTGS